MRTLHLASPLMAGPDVRTLQLLLEKGHYGEFLRGPVDGVYGPLTAQAVHRAKYWLGYRTPNKSAGRLLRHLLAGGTLPPKMAERRKRRLARKEREPLRLKALRAAKTQVGVHESKENVCKFTVWWGKGPMPWCAVFASWSYITNGSKAFTRGSRFQWCPAILADAQTGKNGLALTKEPKPGDLVLFDWNGDGTPDHVGLFEKWLSQGKTFQTVEGNSGDAVRVEERGMNVVRAFVHVSK